MLDKVEAPVVIHDSWVFGVDQAELSCNTHGCAQELEECGLGCSKGWNMQNTWLQVVLVGLLEVAFTDLCIKTRSVAGWLCWVAAPVSLHNMGLG